MTKVGDIMNTDVKCVSPSTPVIEVAHQMRISKRGAIPVCNHLKFWGAITERDIVNVVATAGDPVTLPAGSLIKKQQPFISPSADLMEAAEKMAGSGIRVLPVVQDGKLVGLFTLEDLARQNLALAAMVFSKILELQVSSGQGGTS